MDINKHIVDQRVKNLINERLEWFKNENDENRRISKAFLIIGVASYLDIEYEDVLSLITDGGNDCGVDAVYIGDVTDTEFNVVIFQAKYKHKELDNDYNFPANDLLRTIDGIKSIFDPVKAILMNEYIQQKITEIRSLLLEGNIPIIRAVLISNGLIWNAEGVNHIENAGFPREQIAFEHFNQKNIVERIGKSKKVNDTVSMSGKSVVEEFNFKRVLIGKVSINEISRLTESHGDYLFEKNIRKFLGLHKNRVNNEIKNTLLDDDKKNNFFFYNNGITMVCSKFSYNALASENWFVKAENMQIINGGQTCRTIFETIRDNQNDDFSKVYVLLRLYEVSDQDENVMTDITVATNSQNPVDLRDLRANEEMQKKLEISIAELGYTYRRKRETSTLVDSIPSSVAAEAVYAIWKQKPHVAKFKRNELFGSYYKEIFTDDLNGAQVVLAVLIYRYSDAQRKKTIVSVQDVHKPYSNYFIAMIIGQLLLKKNGLIYFSQISHKNFTELKSYFETKNDELYLEANSILNKALREYFNDDNYANIDGRRLAATFRRYDLIELIRYE